ncbi:hypothetical protein, partial [Agrobacterium sp. D14]|uniref:hypothetical protein n=1 Tax=Agrobacterium sp. D14 TaxID=1336743 RepID=UPI001AED07EE
MLEKSADAGKQTLLHSLTFSVGQVTVLGRLLRFINGGCDFISSNLLGMIDADLKWHFHSGNPPCWRDETTAPSRVPAAPRTGLQRGRSLPPGR